MNFPHTLDFLSPRNNSKNFKKCYSIFISTNLACIYQHREPIFFPKRHGCQVRDSPAGLFAWVNLSQFLPFKKNDKNTEKSERQLFMELLNNYKLYIPMGTPFGSQDPGWFRVIISIRRDHWNEFCKRFDDFVRCKKTY